MLCEVRVRSKYKLNWKIVDRKGRGKIPTHAAREWGTGLRQRLPAGLSKDSGFLRFSRQMKETLISGKILLSLTCCAVHTSRRLGYIVPAIGGLNPGNSGLEDNVPRHMDRYISSLLLAAIAVPTAIIADPRPQDASSRSESTIGTTVIIITGPITRNAH